MCRPASMIVTKDRVFWSKRTNSHDEIRAEFGLTEQGVRGVTTVPVEIVPPDETNYAAPLEEWRFVVDLEERLCPEWFDAATVEAAVRRELPAWVAHWLVLPGQVRGVRGGSVIAAGGTVTAYHSSTVTACGSSTVTAHDSQYTVIIDRRNGIPTCHVGLSEAACQPKENDRDD